jgi:hypothetical protein
MAALAVGFAAIVAPANAQLAEVRIFLTGESIPAGQTRTYSIADRICIGIPLRVTVSGGDTAGTPITVCAVSTGAAIGVMETQSGPRGFTHLPAGTRIDPESGVITRPPGWVAPQIRRYVPPPAGTPGPSVDKQFYIGQWRGRVNEPEGQFKSYAIDVAITEGSDPGTLFADVRYGSYNCTARWTAYYDTGVNDGVLAMHEVIVEDGLGCSPGNITLTPNQPNRVAFLWTDPMNRNQATGYLTRAPSR